MEQLFSAGKAYLKINSLVKTPLQEFMAVERSGLWAPDMVLENNCVIKGRPPSVRVAVVVSTEI